MKTYYKAIGYLNDDDKSEHWITSYFTKEEADKHLQDKGIVRIETCHVPDEYVVHRAVWKTDDQIYTFFGKTKEEAIEYSTDVDTIMIKLDNELFQAINYYRDLFIHMKIYADDGDIALACKYLLHFNKMRKVIENMGIDMKAVSELILDLPDQHGLKTAFYMRLEKDRTEVFTDNQKYYEW